MMDGAGGSGGAGGGLAAAAAAAAAAVAAAAASPGGSGAGGSNSHSLYFDKDGLELAFKYFRYNIITSYLTFTNFNERTASIRDWNFMRIGLWHGDNKLQP